MTHNTREGIEETVERLALELEDDFLEYDSFVQDEQPTGKKGVDDENQKRLIIRKILTSQQQTHHQELQKARADSYVEGYVDGIGVSGLGMPEDKKEELRQTIIDRHQSELDQQ